MNQSGDLPKLKTQRRVTASTESPLKPSEIDKDMHHTQKYCQNSFEKIQNFIDTKHNAINNEQRILTIPQRKLTQRKTVIGAAQKPMLPTENSPDIKTAFERIKGSIGDLKLSSTGLQRQKTLNKRHMVARTLKKKSF